MSDRDVNVLARKLADALDERNAAPAELEKAAVQALQDVIDEIGEALKRLIMGSADRVPIERVLRSLVRALES
jgi:hypothetical protein